MPLSVGDKLGPYEILAPIGAGGMGEVWQAHDPRLNRDVAIKVSAAQFSERFEREAKAIAALNHPNICQIYDVGPNYLVMEFIEGESPEGPMPLDEVLHIARQIAEALEAAHEKGITHRDLKPGNIKIKTDGTVKVLDFGLAKIHAGPAASGENSPTLTIGMTQAGMILGTAAYMSPEQARGKESVDKRADIWAFGVVLYELLTGKRLFQGEDVGEILASVIKEQPNLEEVPRQVRPLLKRCLEKDPKKRLRDIGDAWALLAEESESVAPAQPATTPRHRAWVPWCVAAFMMLALMPANLIHFRENAPETPRLNLSVLPPEGTTFDFSNYAIPAISPDGTRMVFGAKGGSGRTQLWVRRLDSGVARPLPGTEDAFLPFWSPDSQYIGFGSGVAIKKVDVVGGPPVTLTSLAVPLRGGTWNAQGIIVYSANGPNGLFQIPAAGGTPTAVTPFDAAKEQTGHRFPWFLPDGRHFLYLSSRTGDIPVLVGSLDDPKSPGKQVALANSNAIYANGQLLYLRDTTLMAQPFDPVKLAITGEAKPIAEGVTTYMQPSRVAGMSVSSNGLLTLSTSAGQNTSRSRLIWVDRSGKSLGTAVDLGGLGGGGIVDSLELSPDQRSLALSLNTNGGANIWIVDLARGVPTRFTLAPNAYESSPVWSPDGLTLFWHSARREQMFRKASNGAGIEQPLHMPDVATEWPTSISPDGKFLLYSARGLGARGVLIWPLGQTEGGKSPPQALTTGTTTWSQARFSPDGKWVAYQSLESGLSEVYVVPFPGPGGKRQISTGGGFSPRWRRDGKEIFFVTADGRFVATEVAERNATLEIGRTQVLFSGLTKDGVTNQVYYDVGADGKKFIVTQGDTRDNAASPVTVIQNWTSLVKK